MQWFGENALVFLKMGQIEKESVQVSEHCLLALRVIFHDWQWKMEMFGK